MNVGPCLLQKISVNEEILTHWERLDRSADRLQRDLLSLFLLFLSQIGVVLAGKTHPGNVSR